MSVIILLIVISLIVAVFFLVIFFWAVNSGQYDDTYSPSVRMLFEDKKPAGKARQAGVKKDNDKGEEEK